MPDGFRYRYTARSRPRSNASCTPHARCCRAARKTPQTSPAECAGHSLHVGCPHRRKDCSIQDSRLHPLPSSQYLQRLCRNPAFRASDWRSKSAWHSFSPQKSPHRSQRYLPTLPRSSHSCHPAYCRCHRLPPMPNCRRLLRRRKAAAKVQGTGGTIVFS